MPKISEQPTMLGSQVANNDILGIIDVGSPNISEQIIVNEFAQAPQFTSRYAPLASNALWVPAGAMAPQSGSPTLGTLGATASTFERTGVWLLDPDAIENVEATVIIPQGWTTANVFLWWSNADAGAGDVRWSVFGRAYADATTTAATTLTLSTTTITAPAQYIAQRSQVGTNVTSMSAGTVYRISVTRSATNVADTLTNDVGVIGLEIVRAS